MPPDPSIPEQRKEPWHQSIVFLVIAILIVGPLALPLVWINRKMSLFMKVSLTVLLVALTGYLIFLSDRMIGQIQSRIEEIRSIL